jgi:hypothetical protein
MQAIEKFVMGAFLLIFVYLLFQAQNASQVIGTIGSTTGGLFGTLQGRNVDFSQGTVSGSVSGGY